MDIRQLRYFLAIVEQGSFSRAASFLNVAQPALSQHVQNMEGSLGSRLVMRGPKGVVPTEAGKLLAQHARIILDQLATAEQEIRGSEAQPVGEVRLGLPGTISEILSVPLLREIAHRHPGVRLRIAEAMSGFVLEWMRRGSVDLGVIYQDAGDPRLSVVRLLDEELLFFGPDDGGPACNIPSGDTIRFEEVAGCPLIVPGQPHGLRELLEAEAARAGLSLNVAMEVDAYSNIKALVAGGFGYSILPLNAIKQELASGALRRWAITPALRRSVHLACPAQRSLTNAAAAVVNTIHDVLEQLHRRGDWAGVSRLALKTGGDAPRPGAPSPSQERRLGSTAPAARLGHLH